MTETSNACASVITDEDIMFRQHSFTIKDVHLCQLAKVSIILLPPAVDPVYYQSRQAHLIQVRYT